MQPRPADRAPTWEDGSCREHRPVRPRLHARRPSRDATPCWTWPAPWCSKAGPAAVTMGTVADRAEVTRALVYKHFDNRDDILATLYRREAAALDRQLRAQGGGGRRRVRAEAAVLRARRARGSSTPMPRSSRRCAPSATIPTQRRQQRTLGPSHARLLHRSGLRRVRAGSDRGPAGRQHPALGRRLPAHPGPSRPQPPTPRRCSSSTFVGLAVGGLRNLANDPGRRRPAERPAKSPQRLVAAAEAAVTLQTTSDDRGSRAWLASS